MKNKSIVISIVLFLSILMMLIFCQKQKTEWKGTIEEENGVTVVKNPKEPMYEEEVFSLEEDLTIREKGKNTEPLFISLSAVRVDDEENIYALDSKACQVKVFDKNGKHLRDFGRKGQGPGEMQLPTIMRIVSGKEIMICDLPNNRISFFSLQGELLSEVSKGKFFRLTRPMPDSNKNFVGSIRIHIEGKTVEELMMFDSNFEKKLTIEKIEYTREYNVSNIFSPMIFYTMLKDDKVLWGNWLHYQLHISDEKGKTIRKIIKDYDPIRTTDEDRKRWIKEMYGDRGIPPDMKLEFPEYYPAFWLLSADDEGRAFIQTFEKTEEGGYYYDVFDSEGKYIAKIPLATTPRAWKMNKLYTIEEDEEGYQVAKRYKVTWRYQ